MGFDPASIALMSLAVGAVGTGVAAYGAHEQGQAALQQGIAQQQSADYQAQVARNNKIIADENVSMTQSGGAAREAIQGMKTRAAAGETKAGQGASGVDVNSGSNADVRSAEAKLGALDALTIRSNTAREAYGYEVKSTSETAQAGLLERQGSQALTAGEMGAKAGDISALGTFLNGASSVGGKYAGQQLGVGGAKPPATSGPDLQGGIWPT